MLALVLAASTSAISASAAPGDASGTASAPDKARAADLFNQSADAYRRGDFASAIKLLDEAYGLDPQPVLLYNRARAAEGLGDIDAAIAGYEKFLADEPNPPDRGAIEQRVSTLKRQRDERAALVRERDAKRDEPPPAPAPPPTAKPEEATGAMPPPHRNPLPYVVAGVGAAGLVAGTIIGVLAVSKKNDAVDERTQQKSMDLKSSADGLATASTVSFIVGSVLVVAGVAYWLVDSDVLSKKKHVARVRPYLSPFLAASGVGVSLP